MVALGVSPDVARGMVPHDESYFDVLPENVDAVRTFMALQTQWQWLLGMKALRTGLNYQSMESAMRMMKIEDTVATFEGVRVMEDEVLKIDMKKG